MIRSIYDLGIMNRKNYLLQESIYLLFIVTLCISCNNKKDNDSQVETGMIDTELDNDSSSVSGMEEHDWLPEEYKNEHHDEWVVVKQCIDIQQGESGIDFNEIDRLVKEFIHTQKINLPTDKYLQIRKIEDICVTKFDISGYDDSNMGMYIADGTSRLFEEYVNWLLAQETKKIKNTGIDIQEEYKMLEIVMNAFISCCDTIGGAFEGSGGWNGYSQVEQIGKDFKKATCVAILNPQSHNVQPLLLTPKHFKDECEARIKNYKQKGGEETPSSKTVKSLIDKYYLAMKQWLEYRDRVEKQISNPELKAEYAYITRSFAREQYIHLKNVFGDMGMCSASMYDECYLHLDCSDNEMLHYSYEKALDKYLKRY